MSNDQTRATKLYIFWFLHQTTTSCQACQQKQRCISFDSYIKPQRFVGSVRHRVRCISFDSYIKPQPSLRKWCSRCVVYLLIPTSNHNVCLSPSNSWMLYIFWFLHQTTTSILSERNWVCCISFDSYIKPQQCRFTCRFRLVVYLLIPTSNHNWSHEQPEVVYVVYLLIPTSNHNSHRNLFTAKVVVYLLIPTSNHNPLAHHPLGHAVVYLLIPTSNHNVWFGMAARTVLYIFWFLHQTTTRLIEAKKNNSCISFDSYIKPQLKKKTYISSFRCISFDSYIKPQPAFPSCLTLVVVYLLIPTSNHNLRYSLINTILLYIFWFLHQTTTSINPPNCQRLLYIFWFLHQTTTHKRIRATQRWLYIFWFLHQTTTLSKWCMNFVKLYIFWFLHQTTTACRHSGTAYGLYIFWFLHQTTTLALTQRANTQLYIFWFLHQTTTVNILHEFSICCISFDSYIKPQLVVKMEVFLNVVYLLIPTSNHNWSSP